MIVNTGSKDFWLSLLILYFIIEYCIVFFCSMCQLKKDDHYTVFNSFEALIAIFICLMWWFGS
jgi:hypothetical protein